MRIADGNVISFQEAIGRWKVTFTRLTSDDVTETWEVTVIGWAVVVCEHLTEENTTATDIEPVVLDEGIPTTISDYRQQRSGFLRWEVSPVRD